MIYLTIQNKNNVLKYLHEDHYLIHGLYLVKEHLKTLIEHPKFDFLK